MTQTNLSTGQKEAKLLEIISGEILEVGDEFSKDTDLFDAGLDSMAVMQLMIQIETHFGVKLKTTALTRENFSTVRKIASMLQ